MLFLPLSHASGAWLQHTIETLLIMNLFIGSASCSREEGRSIGRHCYVCTWLWQPPLEKIDESPCKYLCVLFGSTIMYEYTINIYCIVVQLISSNVHLKKPHPLADKTTDKKIHRCILYFTLMVIISFFGVALWVAVGVMIQNGGK